MKEVGEIGKGERGGGKEDAQVIHICLGGDEVGGRRDTRDKEVIDNDVEQGGGWTALFDTCKRLER